MNIGRAKTILIYAFLGLNLLLFYHLFGGELRRLAWVAVSPGDLRYVENRLGEYGYMLEAKVDRRIRKSTFLTVTPSRDVELLLRSHFQAAAATSMEPEGERLYEGEGVRIIIYPGGLTRIEYTPRVELLEETVPAEGKDLVSAFERFVRDKGPAFPAARFDFIRRSGGRTVLHYVQTFEGRPLYSGYLDAILEHNTLAALEIYWLEAETSFQEREMEGIPVTEALQRLIELLGPSPRTCRIIKADLGFYSRNFDAEEWEVPPVWRFLFENGDSYFINAFTGNLELETSN